MTLAKTVPSAQINFKNIKCCLKQSRQHKLIFKIYHGGQNSRGSPNKSLKIYYSNLKSRVSTNQFLKYITLAKTLASAQIDFSNLLRWKKQLS